MQLGIFAKTFTGTTPAVVLGAARAAGYDAVQYNMACSGFSSMPDEVPDGVANEVRAAAGSSGVAVVALSATYNMIHPDPAVRRRGHERLRVLAGAARTMGTGLLTLCTGTRDPNDQWRVHLDNGSADAWTDLLASMETALQIAEDHDLSLGIEPELANVIDSAAKARRLIDTLGSPRLKVVLDPANLFEVETKDRQRVIVSSAVALLADRIVMAHAKDRNTQGGFVAAGTGVLDYDHYLRCLEATGFDGALVTHGLAAEQAAGVSGCLRARMAG